MRLTCEQIELMLIDYLDQTLDESARQQIDRHIAACSTCASRLALQKSWLEDQAPLLREDSGRQPAADLSLRIKQAIHEAAREEEEEKSFTAMPLPWYRRPLLQRALMTAAAVVILAVSIQVFAGLYQRTFRPDDSRSEMSADPDQIGIAGLPADDADYDNDYDAERGVRDEDDDSDGIGPVVTESNLIEPQPSTQVQKDEKWQIYSGSLIDLPVGASLFDPADDPADDPDAPVSDDARQPIDLLQEAEAIRILVRDGPPAETLIMAIWPEDEAEAYWLAFLNLSRQWPYKTQMSLVEADTEQQRLQEILGEQLVEELFTSLDLKQRVMIQIRLGE